jgi:hypothetical protein
MNKIKLVALLSLLTALAPLQAQTAAPAMADQFRADGKIYVVITVLALIFLALVVFLTIIERRVAKIEKHLHQGSDKK